MFTKSKLGLAVLAVLTVSDEALGRIKWLERENRAVSLHPRRFGQEHPAVITKLSQACDGAVCGNLAGAAITPLLAAQPECSQQDMADQIIDAAQQFDETTKSNMIALAIEYRQAEKNTPPDFTTNPATPRNSVFCQKAPKNSELNGLVQAQDPANGNIFFDPASKLSVKRGDQPNTFPFGQAGGNAGNTGGNNTSAGTGTSNTGGDNNGTATDTNNGNVGGAAGNTGSSTVATVQPSATATSGANNGNAGGAAGSLGNFGSCSVPEVEFGAGFDGRKETSFRPVDRVSYDHGSAQGFQIISQFICDTLTNKCGADQTAKNTCQKATDAANAAPSKTGTQADAFNAAFGKQTNFAQVQAIDDQGKPVAGTGVANNGDANPGNTGSNNSDASTGSTGNTGNANAGGTGNTGAGAGGNLQTFTESLGGVTAPAVTANDNGEFQVNGNSFKELRNAVNRSCDIQNNQCANAANSSGNQGDLTVANCNAQQQRCLAAAPQ